MGHYHPGDPLQIAWNFNMMFVDMFGDYVQNFSQICELVFELQVSEEGYRSRFFTREFASL
jgi:hypothetical protein